MRGALKKRIVIAGGGASGMCAGILLARAGCLVTVLEKTGALGKKLSMTGNGRCNLSNLLMDASCYNEAARPLLRKLLDFAGTEETIAFFRSIGVLLRDEEGYIYPVSGRAKQVVTAMADAFAAAGGHAVFHAQVKRVTGEGPFTVHTTDASYDCDAVILATGGLSGPKKTGSTGDGYFIAESLGASVTARYPALVRLLSDDKTLPKSTGVRVLAGVVFTADGKIIQSECGEVQLTKDGISGIPVLQASAAVARALSGGARVEAVLDLFPFVADEEWFRLLRERVPNGGETLSAYLNGMSHTCVNDMILAREGLHPDTASDMLDEAARGKLLQRYRALSVPVSGTADYTQAQATAGGVAFSSLTDALECVTRPGVYCIGELTDADGRCGGYNLQWAWMSAFRASNDILSKYDQNNAN